MEEENNQHGLMTSFRNDDHSRYTQFVPSFLIYVFYMLFSNVFFFVSYRILKEYLLRKGIRIT